MRKTKRRMETLSFYDHTGIAAHLEKMAAKGWMLDRIANYGWTYKRIEPKKLHFAASYDAKASEYDPEYPENQQTFHDFCAHTGWKLECTFFQMQVFCNEQENPVPIETDPVLEVENIHASMMKHFFWGAREAYRVIDIGGDLGMDRYLLCYEDVLADIRFSWEPTLEQMAIVGQKIG